MEATAFLNASNVGSSRVRGLAGRPAARLLTLAMRSSVRGWDEKNCSMLEGFVLR